MGMSTRMWVAVAASVVGMGLGACSHIPHSATPVERFAELSCAELDREAAMAEDTARAANQAKDGAWKVIFPVAVAARYFDAASALTDADLRTGRLREARWNKRCDAARLL